MSVAAFRFKRRPDGTIHRLLAVRAPCWVDVERWLVKTRRLRMRATRNTLWIEDEDLPAVGPFIVKAPPRRRTRVLPPPVAPIDHGHQCARCNHHWECLQAKCQAEKAARINKSGPFCFLCFHLVMAKRYAAARHLSFPAILALLGDFTDVE